MPRLSNMFAAIGDITIGAGATTITGSYRPGVYTEAYEAKLLAASKASPSITGIDDLNQLLCDVFVRWDLTDDNDEIIPLTREALAEALPLVASQAISQALMKALRGGEAIRAAQK